MLCYNFGRTIRKTFSLWMEWIYVFSFLTNPIYNILTTKKWNVYLVRRDKGWQLTVCFGRPHLVIIHVHNVLELERKLGRPSASALSGHGGGEAARKCALLLLNLINTIKWEKVLLWHSAYLTFPCMPPRDHVLLTTDLMQRAAMLRVSMVMVCVVADGCFHQVDNWCLFAGPLIITILTRAAAEAASGQRKQKHSEWFRRRC